MKHGFTLIELLVVVAILGTMVAVGVVSVSGGKSAAQVKAATRDVFGAIRHARSVALATGQRVVVTYSNEKADDENKIKVEIVSAKLMTSDKAADEVQPYFVKNYKELPQAQVQSEKTVATAEPTETAVKSEEGETIEEILFAPIDDCVVKGMCVKAVKGEEIDDGRTEVQRKTGISIFSNVDYLLGKYQEYDKAKSSAAAEETTAATSAASAPEAPMTEKVSVIWQSNGKVEAHKVWIYSETQRPEQGQLINIDEFGGMQVLSGDGREDD